MRLLIASPSQGHYGGIEAFVFALAAAAQEWPGFEVQVCFKLVQGRPLRSDLEAEAAAWKFPVHFVRCAEARLLRLIAWSDVVHAQNTSPDILFPARFLGKKLVLTIHNWRRTRRNVLSFLRLAGARMAHRRWYNSRFVWDTWEPDRKWSGSDCVPTVCRFPETSRPAAERRGFLFIGRWIENKGIEELLTAYAQAGLDPVQWPLVLLGDGPLKSRVQSLIASLGISVHTPGFVTDEEKAQRLASARWLVAPAKTREDLGLTPIEARSAGVPVIVTRDGGLPEAGGPAALIVKPGDAGELTAALKQAAAMTELEYNQRAELGRTTLRGYLRPMTFYRDSYLELHNSNFICRGGQLAEPSRHRSLP